jgi:hypothetical protein
MKTEVIMKRNLFNCEIKQKSQTGFFSATDLVRAGNKWRILNNTEPFNINEYFRLKGTEEFMEELSKKYGEIKIARKGRGKDTWVHPILFIDIALSISPVLKVETYEWLFDNLIKFRNDSGDNYKIMAGCLFSNTKNKSNFHKEISEIANKIQLACNIKDWQLANESQLQLRNKIHNDIALLADVLNDNNQAVAIAIRKAINN